MEYERKYQNRINWQNTPNMSTPLNATNLNKMDVALQYMDGKLAEASGDIVSIEANPSGTATSNLTKLKVDSTIYNVGSYTAGTGINIVNGAIQNTETGARSGIIDSISSSRAHTQITLATNETFKPYETLILKSETSGSASTLRVQYASSASSVYDYNLYDTDGTTAKTLSLESGQIIIVMLDQTGYKAIVLSDGISGGASSLSALTDTSISNPSNGQVLGYNSTSGKWENQNPSGGGGSTVSKTNYRIESSSWSTSRNADGYYTSTFTVSPTLDTSVPPNIYISGGGGQFQPTDAFLANFKYIKRARLSGTTMTLYATTKPNSSMQIYVEGVEGSGSGDTMVNVVPPNGVELNYSTSEQDTGVAWIDGKKIYQKTYSLTLTNNNPQTQTGYFADSYWDGLETSDKVAETIVGVDIVYTYVEPGDNLTYTKTPSPHSLDAWVQRPRHNSVGLSLNAFHWYTGMSGATVYFTVRYTKV